MHKLASATLLALALFLFAAVPALAAAGVPVTTTQHQHYWVVTGTTNPVTGDSVDVTFDGNAVEHLTYFPATDKESYTITETGSIQFLDNGVEYSGRATFHSTYKISPYQTITLSIHALGTDGTSVWGHETAHITYNGNGLLTVSFDKLSFD